MNILKISLFCLIFGFLVDQTLGRSPPLTCRFTNEEYAIDPKRPQNTCETYGCYDQFVCRGTSDTGDCYCKKGYARLFPNRPCISINTKYCAAKLPPTPEYCSKRENEVFKEYAGKRMCENTCENFMVNCPIASTLVITWRPRCDCKEGYARLPNGKCVSVTEDERCYNLYKPSHVQCRLRGEFYHVGQMCERIPNCENPNGPEMVCMAIGPMPRCYCHDGYLRNNKGICVLRNDC